MFRFQGTGSLVFIETNASGTGLKAVGRAYEMGLRPVFCANDPDAFRRLPNNEHLDHALVIQCDTYSVESVESALQIHSVEVAGVIALDEYHLVVAAQIAEKRGLRFASWQGIENAKRKDRARDLLAKAGYKQPRTSVVKDSSDQLPDNLTFPVVVKPVDDSGSVGVSVCRDLSSYTEALERNLGRVKNVRGYTLTPSILVEEYIDGPEFSAEFLRDADGWHLLGYTDRALGIDGETYEVAITFPADPEGNEVGQNRITGWLDAVGLDTTAAHVEFRVVDGEYIPVEINPRLMGGNGSTLIKAVTGFDPMDFVLESAVRAVEVPRNLRYDGFATAYFPMPPKFGTITAISYDRESLPSEVFEVALATSFPRLVSRPMSNYDWLGYILAHGTSAENARSAAVRAAETLEVVMDDQGVEST